MSEVANKETRGFQTEVKQLLHLVVHSLYSNKEIFLREMISNASDANDKLRFAAVKDNALYGNDSDLRIRVEFDEEARTITVSDNGIGMTRDEVVENLGTIAKSGTKAFLQQLTGEEKHDSHLIGQFGVGFYSGFIVADRLTVKTRKAGAAADEAVRWESDGEGEFTIEQISKSSRGTDVILHLKDGEGEFLNDHRLRSIITKYSDHISWPIEMTKMAMPSEEEGDEAKKDDNVVEYEVVNRATALWTRAKRDIKDDEYKEFYKHISHDFDEPLKWSHNRVEGKQQYTSLLYIPKKAPFDLFQQEARHGLKLFVQRVFVMDEAEQFLPRYLRFVKGVIDSSDLPLNVSREILQENKLVDSIRAGTIKRVLGMLRDMADKDPDEYAEFWKNFGLVLKEGPIEDFENKEDIASLLRFSSTFDSKPEQTVSLDDYVARMKEGQDKIYFITAESFNAAAQSPHLEIFRKKGIEVLLLSDPIDEWVVGHLANYKEKSLQSITKGELDMPDVTEEEKKRTEELSETFDSLVKHVKEVLGDRVEDVRITQRLTDSPACVVTGEHAMARHMEQMLKAAGHDLPSSKPIFELNPEHTIVQRLNSEADDDKFADWTHILFDQAILAEGGHLDEPAQFVKRLNGMLIELAG